EQAVALGMDERVWWIGYLPDDLVPAHPLRWITRSKSSPPPHVGVGIFIVKNSRETMAARSCNRQFASPSLQAWDGVWRPEASSLRRRLELGEAFIEGFGRDRPHVDIDHLGELRGLRGRELAGRDRGDDLRRRRHAVGGLIERWQLESDRLALPPRRGGPCTGEWPPYRLVLPSRSPCARSPRRRPPTNFPSAALPDCGSRAAGRRDFRTHPSDTAWLIPFCGRPKIRLARPRLACAQQKTRRSLPPGWLAYFR